MKKRIKGLLIVLSIILVLFLLLKDNGVVLAKMGGYQALKVFVQLKDSNLEDDFIQKETEHFIIKYKAEDKDVVKEVADELERSYQVVGEEFNYFPAEKTQVFIYNTQQEMWGYQRSIKGQAVLGLYNFGVIHILSPKAYAGNGPEAVEYFVKNGPVLHEYTHKVVDDLSNGNVELWLTEGIALYEELDKNGVEWEPGFEYAKYFTADELRNDFMNIEEIQAYRQSLDTIRVLVEKYGKNKVTTLLEELKKGNTLDKAFYTTYGIQVDDFINSLPNNM